MDRDADALFPPQSLMRARLAAKLFTKNGTFFGKSLAASFFEGQHLTFNEE